MVFIVAYSVHVLAPWIPRGPGSPLFRALVVAWLVFVVGIVVRVVLTPRGARWTFLRTHPVHELR